MAESLLVDPSNVGFIGTETPAMAHAKYEEPDHSVFDWYFSREEIEKYSPSRKDGIDLRKETYLRSSYCTFLQDLGMRLKVPQVTIATAITFCHRFFQRQSHAKNDRNVIATVCMFLAAKVEETPRLLRDVILVSCEIRSKKDPQSIQRIKQKEFYEKQKGLVLFAEKVVLKNLGFDLNVHHPYKPLVAAIKKFKVAQNALVQVAWNFVNDGLRTSLCLQFKPHHIAAGAIFLAAKFLKVKLPSNGQMVWWQEFQVTPQQLEDFSNQMLELYEQNGVSSASRGDEPVGSSGANNCQMLHKTQSNSKGTQSANGHSQYPQLNSLTAAQHRPGTPESHDTGQRKKQVGVKDVKSSQKYVSSSSYDRDDSTQDIGPSVNSRCTGKNVKSANCLQRDKTKYSDESTLSTAEVNEINVPLDSGRRILEERQGNKLSDYRQRYETKGRLQSNGSEQRWSHVGIGDVNKDKVKAALEKRRKSRGERINLNPNMPKADLIDEDALIELELESGVEAAAKAEKVKQERKESQPELCYRPEQEDLKLRKECSNGGGNGVKRKRSDDENTSKKRERFFDQLELPDEDQKMVSAEAVCEQREEGELPNSPADEWAGSPRFSDSRSRVSNQLENSSRSKKRRDYGDRDQHRHRNGSHDNKRWHDYHHRHHSYNRHHRAGGDRDRHRSKDRDWQEHDYKKRRCNH
eukprot:Gb_10896 [translate_table: standard]